MQIVSCRLCQHDFYFSSYEHIRECCLPVCVCSLPFRFSYAHFHRKLVTAHHSLHCTRPFSLSIFAWGVNIFQCSAVFMVDERNVRMVKNFNGECRNGLSTWNWNWIFNCTQCLDKLLLFFVFCVCAYKRCSFSVLTNPKDNVNERWTNKKKKHSLISLN